MTVHTRPADASLADRLVYAREACGLSTAQVARRLGVRTNTLTGWESGAREPRSNRVVMLAGVLNVSPGWLLSGDGAAPEGGFEDVALIRGELRRLQTLHEETARTIERITNHVETLERKLERAAEEAE